MEVKGRWKSTTAGGGLDQLTWRVNPQYILRVDDGEEVTLTLKVQPEKLDKSEKDKEERENIGFAIMKNAPNDNSLVVDVNDGHGEFRVLSTTPTKKGAMEVSHRWTTSEPDLPYRIIPYNAKKKSCSFTLSTTKGELLLVASELSSTNFSGQWTKESSGGSVATEKAFFKNEQFFLSLSGDAETDHLAIFVLGRESKTGFKGKIGFYLIAIEKSHMGKKLKSLEDKEVIYTPVFSSSRELVVTLELKPRHYVLIPCTNEAGHLAKFQMIVYTQGTFAQDKSASVSAPSNSQLKSEKEEDKEKRKVLGTRSRTTGKKQEEKEKNSHAMKLQLHKEEKNIKELEEKIKSLESEKLEIHAQNHELIKQINQLKEVKNDAIEEWEELDHKDDEYRNQIDALIDQINDVKTRKNQREDELFLQIDKYKAELEKYEEKEQQEEDDIDWNAPILTTPQTGEHIEIRGEWKGRTCGGCLNHVTWIYNPQIFLQVAQNSTVTISLFQPKSDNVLAISFYVFRTHCPEQKRVVESYNESDILCEGYFSSTRPSRISKEVELMASSNPYVIVPATFLPGDASQFMVIIKSTNKVTAKLIGEENEWLTVKGEWTEESAGGCSNFSSFINNPTYGIKLTNPVRARFHIFRTNAVGTGGGFDGITIYILKAPEGELSHKLLDYSGETLVKHGNFISSYEGIVEADLTKGNFFLIPSTFNPGKLAEFELRVLTPSLVDPPFQLSNPVFVTVQGAWKRPLVGGSINNEITWKDNPQFLMKITKQIQLTIVLIQKLETKPFGIGWTVSSGTSKLISPPTSIVMASSYRSDIKVKEDFTFEEGDYILVPTTFYAGEEAEFQIQLTSHMKNFHHYVKINAL
eukprot:TRINITY_DN5392_c0_g2_i3.p1 TRINITY_DN5392_c0_g2~~TRINITY_DN5392_c0_g2_i3.p1  ORF type:complete len:863 (+),score=177.45 TRINITY_DN5392_c0_g2_i3:149-2737(+)